MAEDVKEELIEIVGLRQRQTHFESNAGNVTPDVLFLRGFSRDGNEKLFLPDSHLHYWTSVNALFKATFYVVAIIVLIQVVSFFIGAIIAPSPSNSEQLLAVKCVPEDSDQLSIPRYAILLNEIQSKNCRIASTFENSNESTVFAFQMPLPRDGIILKYSRWMSNLIAILIPEMKYASWLGSSQLTYGDDYINGTITMKVRLAVKNEGEEWKEYRRKDSLKRFINCRITAEKRQNEENFDCEMVQLFELQSLFYDYYLINIEFVDDLETDYEYHGYLSDLDLIVIHQNGEFTKIWLSLKTNFTFMTLFTLIWFCNRLRQLVREITLVEKMLIVLGCTITQLNVPLELLTLRFDLPFINFLSDVRQGILYCALLCFWIVFTREHIFEEVHQSKFSTFFIQLSVVLLSSIFLFVFNSTEQGIQWFDPFFSIWKVDSSLTLIFITTALIFSALYFGFLSYNIWSVFRNISTNQTSLRALCSSPRLIHSGIIYRFKFLLLTTLICAALTIVAFIMDEVSEEVNQFDDDSYSTYLDWSSAMFTTVYAMWNCYIMTLLILYAPSHKGQEANVDTGSEEMEFYNLILEIRDKSEECSYRARNESKM
ncbi:wntless-like protein [Dinothrombium tinctorium]|uniref:Protein wntless n=1 Tax=Dinothrombium tinctorium TaxID=1965070 RepID=A0A443RRP5_9ACAR|nr:wntless-like protein [Dinothrombium tinctorium]